MTDRELIELIATQVGALTTRMEKLTKDIAEIKSTMATKQELAEIKATMATKQELAEIRATMATKQELAEIKATMATKQELAGLKDIIVKIENDHGQKLGALLNGYKLHSEKLDRLEKDVTRHEEIIRRMI